MSRPTCMLSETHAPAFGEAELPGLAARIAELLQLTCSGTACLSPLPLSPRSEGSVWYMVTGL